MLFLQLDSCKLANTAMQEIRWKGEGIIDKNNHTIFYCCDKKHHMFGTGFIVSKRIKRPVTDFKAKRPEYVKHVLEDCFFNYSLICVHATIEEKDDNEKDNSYEDLDQMYEQCPKRDVKIVIGDLNAKIGQDDIYRLITGKYSLRNLSSDNGTRLINFACSKNMVVASTLFSLKDMHKMTWRYPDEQISIR